MKYKVGDKVKLKKEEAQMMFGNMSSLLGKTVTISAVNRSNYHIGEDKEDWFWDEAQIECLACNRKIVITTDGTETLARLYEGNKVVKSATAKCSSKDEFDFNTGARLAFDRLFETATEKKEEYYNGKVVCIKAGSCFAYTVGKIYEFRDGNLINDNGFKALQNPVKTLDEWHKNKMHYAEFIPLVE